MCEGLCGKWHQEDLTLFEGAHDRKEVEYMHVYIYYTWELSIFLDIKVCGCSSACIYSTVIASLIYVILLG